MSSAVPSYDKRYSEGGWAYKAPNELKDLQVMVEASGLKPPASIIEVACGMGFHANLLREMGFKITANDYSEIGIANARKTYPEIEFHWGDSRELPARIGRERFDGLMVRGHSHHHYDLPLEGLSRKGVDVVQSTQTMFDLVKPGCVVMMTIRTNFKGDRYADGVHNNTLGAYTDLFAKFGKIVFLSDRHGTPIRDEEHALELGKIPDNRVVVITRKPF